MIRYQKWHWLTPRKIGVLLLVCAVLLICTVPLKLSPPLKPLLLKAYGCKEVTCHAIIWGQGYNMPLVWITACLLFLFFKSLTLPNWMSQTATFLGRSMFGVYLLHESNLFIGFYQKFSRYLAENAIFLPHISIIVLTAIIVFNVCLVIDLLRRACVWSLRRFFLYGIKIRG